MSGADWSRHEVEAIVGDYLSMLASELSGSAYNKTAHRQALKPQLNGRSDQSIEYKHANISAALLEAGFPYIPGYKARFNYQGLVAEVVAERLSVSPSLQEIAAFDADRPIVMPEVEDILSILTEAPQSSIEANAAREPPAFRPRLSTSYIEREARNRSLGSAGETFVLAYERARLVKSGHESLAAKIEHTSKVRGDHEGYDILSFEDSGEERLIEVKTTKYGIQTPFFVTRNEVSVSERNAHRYQVYRMFSFRQAPRLYTLRGSVPHRCHLSAATFLAVPR
ncbi:MAG: DUF3883 domain-containing protein [Burkholderiaceae bacterium]